MKDTDDAYIGDTVWPILKTDEEMEALNRLLNDNNISRKKFRKSLCVEFADFDKIEK